VELTAVPGAFEGFVALRDKKEWFFVDIIVGQCRCSPVTASRLVVILGEITLVFKFRLEHGTLGSKFCVGGFCRRHRLGVVGSNDRRGGRLCPGLVD
jgi:hypothetical protein